MRDENIKLALILGSGLDSLADSFSEKKILHQDKKGVHKRTIFIMKYGDSRVLAFSGRKHFYEGYSKSDIIANVRLAKQYGVKNLLVTNAAGGLNQNFNISDLMLINSHINFNQRFIYPSSNNIYNDALRSRFTDICVSENIVCRQGIYCYLPGPAYETNAEVRMLRKLNVDAVGMSTVPEMLEASRLGIRVLALSVITNLLTENNPSGADHKNVIKAARNASGSLSLALKRLILELN